MNTFTQFFKIICLSILAAGCVIDAPATPDDGDPPNNECGLNAEVCVGNEVCAVIDPCGSACEGGDPRIACPAVCVEIYGCVAAIEENQPCDHELDHCGDDLRCQYAGSGPSFCDGDICTQDYVDIFTCQPNRCDPNSNENTCTGDDVCGITGFESVECSPDGACPDVEPAPIFGCVTPLAQDEVCTHQHTHAGFDQCQEGLVCTSAQPPCEDICDENGVCQRHCRPTPASTCQPEPIVTCTPNSDENTCTNGDVCGITGFETIDCTPDGGCPAVEPAPYFGCVTPLAQDDICTRQHTYSGFDQCGEGLVCTYGQAPCEEICDESGACDFHCLPTPASTCQPEPMVTCDPNSDENTCTDGDVCGITGFEETCTPDGNCIDIEPPPIFGCVPALLENEVCNDDVDMSFGIDRCDEGLVCAPTSGCAPSCDENGFCTSECDAPVFTCQ